MTDFKSTTTTKLKKPSYASQAYSIAPHSNSFAGGSIGILNPIVNVDTQGQNFIKMFDVTKDFVGKGFMFGGGAGNDKYNFTSINGEMPTGQSYRVYDKQGDNQAVVQGNAQDFAVKYNSVTNLVTVSFAQGNKLVFAPGDIKTVSLGSEFSRGEQQVLVWKENPATGQFAYYNNLQGQFLTASNPHILPVDLTTQGQMAKSNMPLTNLTGQKQSSLSLVSKKTL